MKMIDKAIALNFKLIKEPMHMIVVLSFCMIFCLMFFIFIPVAMILGFVITYMIIKIYKTLFVDSVFGEAESIYNALPIPMKESIVSRIFVAMVATIAAEILVTIGLFIGLAFLFNDFDFVFVLGSVLGLLYEAGLPIVLMLVALFFLGNFFIVTTSFASCLRNYKRTGKIGMNMSIVLCVAIVLSNHVLSFAPLSVLAPYGAAICIGVMAVLLAISLWSVNYVKKNIETV